MSRSPVENEAEIIGRLEFLLKWLDEHAALVDAGALDRLRAEAREDLAARREALLVAESVPGTAVPPPPPGPGPQQARVELALIEATLLGITSWLNTGVISPWSEQSLRKDLQERAGELKSECGDRPAEKVTPTSLAILGYALGKLGEWNQQNAITPREYRQLLKSLEQNRASLAAAAPRDREDISSRSRADLAVEFSLIQGSLRGIDLWRSANFVDPALVDRWHHFLGPRAERIKRELADDSEQAEPVSERQIVDYLIQTLPFWAREESVPLRQATDLSDRLLTRRSVLFQPAAPPTAPAPIAPAVQIPAPVQVSSPPAHEELVPREEPSPRPVEPSAPAAQPVPPPPPPAPALDWEQVWQRAWSFVVSGALLRGLLYLGGFMIVVSAIVLVVVYWNVFPLFLQLAFVLALPLSFYLAGFLLRTRLQIPVAGGVFTGIGALLVAVDLGGIYQLGGLERAVDLNSYWLFASIVCTAVYFFTAWWMRLEFFGYLLLLAVESAMLALTSVLHLPGEWISPALIAPTPAIAETAARLERSGETWGDLARAGRRFVSLLLPLFLAAGVIGNIPLVQMAGFLMGALAYGLLTWHFRSRFAPHLAAWAFVAAVVNALRATPLPIQWYASALVVLASIYIVAARRLRGDSWKNFLPALKFAGSGLMVAALAIAYVSLRINLWAGSAALTLGALSLAWFAYLYRRPVLILASCSLFVVPFTFAFAEVSVDRNLPQQTAWLMAGWAVLALAYLGIAAALNKAPRYGMWLNLVAHLLAPATFLGLWLNYLVAPRNWQAAPTLVALALVMLDYVALALIHDSGKHPALSEYLVRYLPSRVQRPIFLWPNAVLLPVWLSILWFPTTLPKAWLGPALGGLGLAFVGAGQLLARRKIEYRLPPHVSAYVLAAVAVAAALGDNWALLAALLIDVAILAALAMVYRRVAEIVAAALLFLAPFQLALELSPLTPHAYSLAYALLAAMGYIPIGILLDRTTRRFARPVYWIGYALSGLALAASLLGRIHFYPLDVPWIGVAVPVVSSLLCLFGLKRFRFAPFAAAAAGIWPIAYGQALTMLRVPPPYDATAWVALAMAYVLADAGIIRARTAPWPLELRRPLELGSILLCTLGLALTSYGTTLALLGRPAGDVSPLILAQVLAVALSILAGRLYRQRLLLYIEPWLAFFPVTLFFVGYGAALFGKPLAGPHFALVWTGLAVVHLVAAAWLDQGPVRYSHGLYFGGYLLCGLALLRSMPDRAVVVSSLGVCILIALASQALIQFARHPSYDDLVLWFFRTDTAARRAARTFFLSFAAYGFPIWLVQLLTTYNISQAWHGLALAITAPIFIALGLAARRIKREYTWPLYSAAYALTAIGAMIAFDDEQLAIYVLALDAGVYAASAYLFRQSFWLYLCNTLVPVIALVALHYYQSLTPASVAVVFMGLAFLFFALGQWFNRRRDRLLGLSPFALPFYAPAYLLSALALGAATGDKALALQIYTAGMVLYAISARAFRESVFLYPAAWLAVVPYYLALTYTALPPAWYGVALLPLIVGYLGLGRLVFERTPFHVESVRRLAPALTHPALPFYLMVYALSVYMITLSRGTSVTATLALAAASAIYIGSALLYRRAVWLYPGLLAAHVAFVALLSIFPTGKPAYYASEPFLAMTWVVALVGFALTRRSSLAASSETGLKIARWEFRKPPFMRYLLSWSWAQPLFAFAAFDILFWQAVALNGLDTALTVALGNSVLLALLAELWQDTGLVYATIAYFLVAVGYELRLAGVPLATQFAVGGGLGFGIYLLSQVGSLLTAHVAHTRSFLSIWLKPLVAAAVLLTALGVVGTLPTVAANPTATAGAFAFAGALYVLIAFHGNILRLAYLGIALLVLAWMLLLLKQDIRQPQLYAIPAGLYFTAVGFVERRRARDSSLQLWRRFSLLVESFGLALLLITSLVQSLDGASGLPYFLLLVVEGLAVIWWGAARRTKVPFFMGLGASALNVVAQVLVLVSVYDVNRFLVILGVGLLLVTIAAFVERQRAIIITKAHEWLEVLETWS